VPASEVDIFPVIDWPRLYEWELGRQRKILNLPSCRPGKGDEPPFDTEIGQLAKLITSKVDETVKAKRDDLFTNQMDNSYDPFMKWPRLVAATSPAAPPFE
jgi:hypothetical protein